MYFWICWFTRRYRLIIYLTLAVALTVLGCLPEAFDFPNGHWALGQMTAMRVAMVWDAGTLYTVGLMLVVMLFAAADLGALAMGEDSRRRELDFLLTRPKSRSYFIWTSWLAGLTELFPLMILPIATSIIVLFWMTHSIQGGVLIRTSLILFVMAAAMYALVFSFSSLSQTAQNGLQIAGFVVFLFAGYRYLRSDAWFDPTYHSEFWGAFDWIETRHQLFPDANLLILLGVVLVLPLVARARFERKDL